MYGQPMYNQHGPIPSNYAPQHQQAHPQAAPQQFGSYAGPGAVGGKAPLIQPPALNVEENINTNSQFLGQKGGNPMSVSNNGDHS